MINEILNNYLSNLNYDLNVINSNRPEICDYQINDAFKLAKSLHKSPLLIGNDIVNDINALDKDNNYFSKVECVNGFVNLTLSDKFINDYLRKMDESDKFNIKKENKKIILDYGGPNVAKPLHVGHMRTAILGEAIKRICAYKGNETISDVHLGDYGLQIGEVIYAIINDKKDLKDINLEYLNEAYPRMSALVKENEDIKNECARITKELQDGNSEYHKYYEVIKKVSVDDIKRLYKYLDVSFDLWEGESDSYRYIPETEKILENKGLLKKSDGALVVDISEESDTKELPPLIFKKSNGAYLYTTTDVATIYERESKYKPDNILYIVDNRQELHFIQVFRTIYKANISDAKLEFLGYGTVNGSDGKPYKTRKGDAPSLDSLFNEAKEIFISKKSGNENMSEEDLRKIVNAILKFADLQNNRVNDYIFDINKFSNVVGKTGPYMLYTVLRLDKILNSETRTLKLSDKIYNDVDRKLRLKIINLESSFNKAYETRMPSYLVDYLYDLAVVANDFYQNNHIASENDEQKKNDYLYVIYMTNRVLKEMLHLVGIDIPSYM